MRQTDPIDEACPFCVLVVRHKGSGLWYEVLFTVDTTQMVKCLYWSMMSFVRTSHLGDVADDKTGWMSFRHVPIAYVRRRSAKRSGGPSRFALHGVRHTSPRTLARFGVFCSPRNRRIWIFSCTDDLLEMQTTSNNEGLLFFRACRKYVKFLCQHKQNSHRFDHTFTHREIYITES